MTAKQDRNVRPIKATEKGFEYIVFSARWLLAPFYLGMVVALVVLCRPVNAAT